MRYQPSQTSHGAIPASQPTAPIRTESLAKEEAKGGATENPKGSVPPTPISSIPCGVIDNVQVVTPAQARQFLNGLKAHLIYRKTLVCDDNERLTQHLAVVREAIVDLDFYLSWVLDDGEPE